jgi:arylsulfatase A-like enzyme
VASSALVGAAALVVAEWAFVGWLARGEFAGPWELWDGLVRLVPLAWLVVVPAALLGALVLALCGRGTRGSRVAVGVLGAAFGIALAAGVTRGRHFAALPVRAAFVLALGGLAFGAAFVAAPWMGRVGSGRAARRAAAVASLVAVAFEIANRLVLPRLYPPFHFGLDVLAGMTAPLVGRGILVQLRRFLGPPSRRLASWASALCAALPVLLAAGLAPANAKKLVLSDNLRFIFFDRAPLVGLGVELAAALAPPPPLDPAELAEAPREGGKLEVDWRDKDILLVSIDALRADHVGAYGYARPTTPNIDRLASQGAMFLRAYCPTPHTSYSVTSMMTGKNLRPLLAQGLGLDSDTFAALLRTYGYRTAAFYPPAVFFIDEELFQPFRDRKLDFEYARVEFADPHERARAVQAYLQSQPADRKVFLWVHLFEPHEPYVANAAHPFGDRDIDRYDGEIALADDGVGEIVAAVRARRPNAVVVLTADHGEEFGEHHGRYHGTTVYEEQVRVPLIVVGPGVAAGRRIEAPVQTIDLLPTVLASLDIPAPPRIVGRSVGRWLAEAPPAGKAPAPLAFAVTDDQTMLADSHFRLVCARRVGACALYDLALDPGETRDVSASERERFAAMKAELHRVEVSHGMYEGAAARATGVKPWPDPIRRGLAGDGEAAREIAALLDDSDVTFRRKAAEVLFDLKRKEAAPELRLALSRDEDDVVRRFAALALTRLGEGAPRTVEMLEDPDPTWRRLAALALAENGDPRGGAALVAWWQTDPPPFSRAREVLAALGQIRAKDAAPALIHSLDDVRLRPYVAEALGAIGQPLARGPLAERWANERYQNARQAIGEALVRLGAKHELVAPLVRFLGTPDPLPGGLDLARRAGVLDQVGGPSAEQLARVRAHASDGVPIKVTLPRGGNGAGWRILVRAHATDGRAGQVRVGAPLDAIEPVRQKTVRTGEGQGEGTRGAGLPAELDPHDAVTFDIGAAGDVVEAFAALPARLARREAGETHLVVAASSAVTVEALAVVPLSDELPPPPPEPWERSH